MRETLLHVDHYTSKGEPIAYLQGAEGKATKVVLSSGVPGDDLLVECGKVRRGRSVGWVKEVVHPSPFRVVPRCAHVPSCGGCALQEMDYREQLLTKQQLITDLFKEIPPAIFHPILGDPHPWHYRNKMEFSFSEDRQGTRYLGLMLKKGRGKVLNLSECHLTSAWFTEALKATRQWWESSDVQAYHPPRDTGTLRTLTLREGRHTGSKMAMLTISGRPEFALSWEKMKAFAKAMKATARGISCFIRIQQAIKGEPTQYFEIHLLGPETLSEELHLGTPRGPLSLSLQISPTSFFQPNTRQAELLYSRALAMSNPTEKMHVLDLYCGIATIGMAFAPFVKEVTAIELNPYAFLDAEANCLRNHFSNVRLLQGDAGERLAQVLQEKGISPFDLIVVDPPRTGLGPKALDTLLRARPERILYIACNPITQAEEVKALLNHGYCLQELQPIDQFPHTPHVETIALLSK